MRSRDPDQVIVCRDEINVAAASALRHGADWKNISERLIAFGRQRDIEQGATFEPGTGSIARIAVECMHSFENSEDVPPSDLISPRKEAGWVLKPDRYRPIDIGWAGDALLGDITSYVDDHCHDTPRDEPGLC
jgi:hypothetical protein